MFDLLDKSFDGRQLARDLFNKFKEKEGHEVERIHLMIDFFESQNCLSKALAGYFGQGLAMDHCGHCSVWAGNTAKLEKTLPLESLAQLDLKNMTDDFQRVAGESGSPLNTAKFLCGIQTPLLTRFKAKKLENFGALGHHPFMAVRAWVEATT